MNDWDHPDWSVPDRARGFKEWEAHLHTPLDSGERATAAAAWDAAWIAHARFAEQDRLDVKRGSE